MIWGKKVLFWCKHVKKGHLELLKPSKEEESTGSYNLFCRDVSHVVPKRELKRKELNSDTSTSLLQQLMPPCFLTTACMLSALLVPCCLARFLMYESPPGFQTSVMEKNPKQ